MQKWIAAIALFLFAPAVVAQDRDIWRFWTFSDGLQETFSYSLGLGPGGSVTIRHGAVPFMSVLDGYTVAHIADPHPEVRANEFTRGRATLAANGSTWAAIDGNLMEYRAGRWKLQYRTPPGLRLITAVPAGSRVIVLFSTALREYDPAGQTWREFRNQDNTRLGGFTAMTARAPDFWISGKRGLARLRVEGDGVPQWNEISGAGAGLSDFRYPVTGERWRTVRAGKGRPGANGGGTMVRQGPGEGLRFLRRRSPRVARAVWIRVDSGRCFALSPDERRKGAGAARWGALRQRVRCLLRGWQVVLAGRLRGIGALHAGALASAGRPHRARPAGACGDGRPPGAPLVCGHGLPAGTRWRGVEAPPYTVRLADPHHTNRKRDGEP